jgi:signal peptidase I
MENKETSTGAVNAGAVGANAGASKPGGGKRKRKGDPLIRELLSLLVKLGVVAVIAAIVLSLVYGFFRTDDPGMSPAIKSGDLTLFYRFDKEYKAGDVLVLRFEGKRNVARVVAIEGDTVDITEDGLVINGALQQEPSIYEKTDRYEEGADFPLVLGEGEVFVLGDARENATDGRIYGAVNENDTLGTVIAVIRRKNI